MEGGACGESKLRQNGERRRKGRKCWTEHCSINSTWFCLPVKCLNRECIYGSCVCVSVCGPALLFVLKLQLCCRVLMQPMRIKNIMSNVTCAPLDDHEWSWILTSQIKKKKTDQIMLKMSFSLCMKWRGGAIKSLWEDRILETHLEDYKS